MSGGRLIIGVGTGWMEAEFKALGVPMEKSGEGMDDALRARRAIWTMEHPEYHGPSISFGGVAARPRPLQCAMPPIVTGGESPLALRRAVTMANGWYGFGLTLEQTKRHLESLRRTAGQHARPAELGNLEITVTPVAVSTGARWRHLLLPEFTGSSFCQITRQTTQSATARFPSTTSSAMSKP